MKRFRMVSIVVAALCLSPTPTQARLIRAFYLDQDVQESQMVFVGEVVGINVTGVEASGSETLDVLSISTLVRLPIKENLDSGETFIFRHRRVNASSQLVINGYMGFDFKPQHVYLLVLQKSEDGEYELPAPEDTNIVEVSAGTLSRIERLPRDAAPLDFVIDVLVKILEVEEGSCAAAIWLLERSEAFRGRLEQNDVKEPFVHTLIRLTKSAQDENTLGAAYTFLGSLNETSVIPSIIQFITQEQETTIIKSNAINWLQGFPPEQQIEALQLIIEQAHDEGALEYAKQRLESNLGTTQGSHTIKTNGTR